MTTKYCPLPNPNGPNLGLPNRRSADEISNHLISPRLKSSKIKPFVKTINVVERVEGVVITNAAGGLNESFNVGDFMIIQDHLYIPGLAGFSPLVGPNDDRIGPRFPPMGDAYNKEWRNLAKSVAADIGENIKSGKTAPKKPESL